jgi:aminomethyltransferase
MPVQYKSIVDEHRSVREAVGLFDVSHMGEIEIAGAGAEAFCRRVFANDAARLAIGQAQYSLIPNDRGGVVDDIIVYRLAERRFLVCVNASNAAKDFAWLSAQPAVDCTLVDRSDEFGLIAVQGPQALSLVAELAPELDDLSRFVCRETVVADIPVLAARTGYTGEDGVELFVASDRTEALWTRLFEAGRSRAVAAVGLGARDTLRQLLAC